MELPQERGEAREFRTEAPRLSSVAGEGKMEFGNGVTQEVIPTCLYCLSEAKVQFTERRGNPYVTHCELHASSFPSLTSGSQRTAGLEA